MAATLSSQLVGRDRTILVLRLPVMVVDEQVAAIRDEARGRLPRVQGAGLILDFTHVELINSIGITCLLQMEEDTRKGGGRMVLTGVSPAICMFLRQLRLDRRFVTLGTADEAVHALEAGDKPTAAPPSGGGHA